MKIRNLHNNIPEGKRLNGFKSQKQLEEVAKDFEAILIGQFFRLMNKTVSSEGVIKKSFERGIYEDMLHDELAKAYAKRGGLNLNKIIVDYFSGASLTTRRGASLPGFRETKKVNIGGIKKVEEFLPLKGGPAEAKKLETRSRYMQIDVKNYKRDLLNRGE